ncbi:MAG: hypothetical protein ACRDLQ_09675 [Solirubrobacterales bacterium]
MAMVGALLALTAVASGQIVQTFDVKVKPPVAGKPISLRVSETTRDDAAPQPPPMTRQVIYLQRGGKFNGKRFRHCRLSQLRKRGPKGCPKRSKIGTGRGTGSAKPILDNVSAKLTLFNGTRRHGRDRVFVFVLPEIGPTFVVVGTIKRRKGRYGHVLDFRIPPIKTLPLAPDASVTSVRTKTRRLRTTKRIRGEKRRYYLIRAPRKCHRYWRAKARFYYANGEVETVKQKMRCKKRKHRRR